ncbi:MAG TPA: hypothetical protein VNZ57_15760 [Longimicrobiales bacterium]|nr:hypothetical protein [Longimicrobiales bacterium]
MAGEPMRVGRLTVRIAGRDADQGRALAREIARALEGLSPTPGPNARKRVRLSVSAGAGATASDIARAIAAQLREGL